MDYSDGTEYKGEWINNKYAGAGVLYLPDGSTVKGIFRNGELFSPQ